MNITDPLLSSHLYHNHFWPTFSASQTRNWCWCFAPFLPLYQSYYKQIDGVVYSPSILETIPYISSFFNVTWTSLLNYFLLMYCTQTNTFKINSLGQFRFNFQTIQQKVSDFTLLSLMWYETHIKILNLYIPKNSYTENPSSSLWFYFERSSSMKKYSIL